MRRRFREHCRGLRPAGRSSWRSPKEAKPDVCNKAQPWSVAVSRLASRRIFGSLADGTPIEALTLGGADGLQAEILTYGGILRRLTLPTRRGRTDLVLGLPDLDAYVGDSAFLGSIVGRFSNRITGASF